MNALSVAIDNTNLSKQQFADKVKIPYYRIAKILYKQANLTEEERFKITSVFGNDIFLTQTKHFV